jgi:hypothetical protein
MQTEGKAQHFNEGFGSGFQIFRGGLLFTGTLGPSRQVLSIIHGGNECEQTICNH